MQASISRHKTAISRAELSRPIKRALDDGILGLDMPILTTAAVTATTCGC